MHISLKLPLLLLKVELIQDRFRLFLKEISKLKRIGRKESGLNS